MNITWDGPLFFSNPYELQNFCYEQVCNNTTDWQNTAYLLFILLVVVTLIDLWAGYKRGVFRRWLSLLKEIKNGNQHISESNGEKAEKPKS